VKFPSDLAASAFLVFRIAESATHGDEVPAEMDIWSGRMNEFALRYFIVGGPIYQTQGSQYAAWELGGVAPRLADRVGFIPFQSDTASVYCALDVVAHASTKPEPFGRTIAEAMACGRAVIAMEAGGTAELFVHKIDAFGRRRTTRLLGSRRFMC
jgi:glycosyltransferase involved in cell wall biosynthesis